MIRHLFFFFNIPLVMFTRIVSFGWKIFDVNDFILRKKKYSLPYCFDRLSFLYVVDAGNIVMATGDLTDKLTRKPVGGSERQLFVTASENISFGTDSFEFFGTLIWLFGSTFENTFFKAEVKRHWLHFAGRSVLFCQSELVSMMAFRGRDYSEDSAANLLRSVRQQVSYISSFYVILMWFKSSASFFSWL